MESVPAMTLCPKNLVNHHDERQIFQPLMACGSTQTYFWLGTITLVFLIKLLLRELDLAKTFNFSQQPYEKPR